MTKRKGGGGTFPLYPQRAAHKGAFYIHEVHGQLIARKWPIARGTPKSQETKDQNRSFTDLVRAVHFVDPEEINAARLLAENTVYTYKDIMIMAMCGTYIEIEGLAHLTIQSMLDTITDVPGSILVRGTNQWEGLAPGTPDQYLNAQGAGNKPIWAIPAGGGGAGGLWSPVLSAVPTQATSGFTTWLNQGSATVANVATGLAITEPTAAGGTSIRALIKTAPSTPYTITALIGAAGPRNDTWGGVGWYDGTNKMHLIGPYSSAGRWGVLIGKMNTPTSYNSNDLFTDTSYHPLVWVRLRDDATNVYFDISVDGASFVNIRTTAKASAWLGPTGYANLVFFAAGALDAAISTLMSCG